MKIFLLGATPSFVAKRGDTPLMKLAKTGGNTGNQIVAYALLNQIKHDEVSWDYQNRSPQEVSDTCDMVLIAATNFLFPGFDFGGTAKYIEAANLPVAIAGLGAQASSYNADIKLPKGTERFLKIVAERAKSIGVRGPFTAEVLAKRGIHNVEVLGCPSYYMRGSLPLVVNKPAFHKDMKLSINASRDVIAHAFDPAKMLTCTRQLYQSAIEWKADFIAQSEPDELQLATGADERAKAKAAIRLAEFICGGATPSEALTSEASPSKTLAWARHHVRAFFNVKEWIEAIGKYDFILGNRFHGNILALQYGVAACVICHDTRTEEMCKFLALPHVNVVNMDSIDVQTLYESLDLDAMRKRHEVLYPRYRQFLIDNALEPTMDEMRTRAVNATDIPGNLVI